MTFVRVLALLAMGVTLSCAAPPDLRVELRDTAVAIDRLELAAGHHVFAIHNAGTFMHELEVIRTDLPPDAIPVDAESARVKERGPLEVIAERERILPGATKRLAVDLSPGRYVLICDMPGHYLAGMHTALTVR